MQIDSPESLCWPRGMEEYGVISVSHFAISVFPSFSVIDHSYTLTHIKKPVKNPCLYILHTTARLTQLVRAQPSRNHETLKREDKKQHRTSQTKPVG